MKSVPIKNSKRMWQKESAKRTRVSSNGQGKDSGPSTDKLCLHNQRSAGARWAKRQLLNGRSRDPRALRDFKDLARLAAWILGRVVAVVQTVARWPRWRCAEIHQKHPPGPCGC